MLLLSVVAAYGQGKARVMVQAVVLAWLSAALMNASIGLLQYFGTTAWAGQWINHTGFGEAYGNLRQRNQFATLMNIGLASLLWWVVATPPYASRLKGPFHRFSASYLLPFLVGSLIGVGNAASSSRTGLIQLILIAALTWWWQRQIVTNQGPQLRPVYRVLLMSLLVYAVALWALPLLAGLDPFASGAWARLRSGDAACSSRLTLWGNVIYLIGQKPWLGWGWGELDYAHFITLYPGARFCDILDNAHNLPLHLAVELGLPLALLVCGLAAWLVWRAKPWGERDATRQLAWAVLAVIGLHSLLEYPLWYGPFQMAALLCVWLLWRPSQSQHRTHDSKRFRPVSAYIFSGTAALIIATCAFIAWNYHLASQIYLPPASRMADYRDDTLAKISNVALFQDQIRFAKLTTTDLDPQNALEMHELALAMLHFSPEARVAELALDSGKLLGRTPQVNFLEARYEAAFPDAYAKWTATQVPK